MTGKYCLPSDSPDENARSASPAVRHFRLAQSNQTLLVSARRRRRGRNTVRCPPENSSRINSKPSKGDAALVQFAPRLPRGKKTAERNLRAEGVPFCCSIIVCSVYGAKGLDRLLSDTHLCIHAGASRPRSERLELGP